MLFRSGLQTVLKLIENDFNNTPLGFSHGRDADNTPILKIITPNLMKIGRIHSRSLNGPMRFPNGPAEYLKKVEECYNAFYQIWNTGMLPKLIPQPKWFKDSQELKETDVVYFEKNASEGWTVGQVESVTKSKDGVVRRVSVRYFNAGDQKTHFTDRAARSLVRLFSIDDNYFIEDMAAVERLVTKANRDGEDKVKPLKLVRDDVTGEFRLANHTDAANTSSFIRACNCCCVGHCTLSHFAGAGALSMTAKKAAAKLNNVAKDQLAFAPILLYPEASDLEEFDHANYMLPFMPEDEVLAIMTALHTKFEMEDSLA